MGGRGTLKTKGFIRKFLDDREKRKKGADWGGNQLGIGGGKSLKTPERSRL